MTSSRPSPRRPGRPLAIAGAIVALAVLAGGAYGLWYLFLKPSGPAPVTDASLPPIPSSSSVSSTSAAASPGSSTDASSLDGTWSVDTEIGSFSDFSGTFVGYRIQEQLASVGGNTAVGRTPNATGTLTLQGSTITAASISADLTDLKSDDDRRDGQLRRQGLQTSQFPTATFTLTSPIDLGSVPADGQTISATAHGQLTLHGQTRDVDIPIKAKRSGFVVVVTGSLPIVLADYGIPKPNSFAVLSIADQGTMEFQIFFSKG
jgi:polyisoprenoid-binding protein YceI